MCFTAARAFSPSSNASCSASSASSSIAFKRSAGDAPLRKSATPPSISRLSALALALAAWLFQKLAEPRAWLFQILSNPVSAFFAQVGEVIPLDGAGGQ